MPDPFTPLPPRPSPIHLFSVDVEDWFQVVAFERLVDRAQWDRYPTRVVGATERLLDLLAARGIHGTFFTLGWVAERQPGLVRRIAAAGHEVACHGYWHRRVFTLDPEGFRQDLREARARLEDASGQPCLGFRAPSFSIRPGLDWAFDVLLEEGFRYDSSLFPIRRPDYGWPGAPPGPFAIDRAGGRLLEFPLATTGFAGLRLPAAGGGYLRQFPPALVRRAFREAGAASRPGMFYIHPWEVDPEQPRLACGRITALRHYRNLDRTLDRIADLLGEFRFGSVAGLYAEELAGAGALAAGPARGGVR